MVFRFDSWTSVYCHNGEYRIKFDIVADYVWFIVEYNVGGFMLSVRRLHDMNKRGWFMFIMIIPYALEILYAYIFFQLYLCLAPGTVGSNRYGEDPLQ